MIDALPSTSTQNLDTSQTATSSDASALASDFDEFLNMLTAQALYQDPLDPIDSSEFSSQLAQFSMVEQQINTNDALEIIIDQMNSSNMAALAGWVGMEVRAITPAHFDGSPIAISPNPASISDRVELVVLDESGNEVQRSEIAVSTEPIEWAGVDDDGDPFAAGEYSFVVESYSGETLILSEPAEVYSKVTEAQVQSGEIILMLEGGQAVSSTSVTGLRNAT